MRGTTWLTAIVLVAASAIASAQTPDPDATKLANQYEAAFNNADAKAIGALYTETATRMGPDGQFVTGRTAIEKVDADGFTNGPLKGRN